MTVPVLSASDVARFLAKTERAPNGCLVWTAGILPYGYGAFHARDAKGRWRSYRAHRVAWFIATGQWPADQVDHECHNRDETCRAGDACPHRRCVDFEHLAVRSALENIQRGHGHGSETACPAGHAYTPENTYVWGRRKMRRCRRCHADVQRAYRARKNEEGQ